LLKTVNLKSGI